MGSKRTGGTWKSVTRKPGGPDHPEEQRADCRERGLPATLRRRPGEQALPGSNHPMRGHPMFMRNRLSNSVVLALSFGVLGAALAMAQRPRDTPTTAGSKTGDGLPHADP